MAEHPRITTEALLGRLLNDAVVDDLQLISLLGADRHHISLNLLELALVRENYVSSEYLVDLKSQLSGLPGYDPRLCGVTAELNYDDMRRYGAIILDRQPLTVAMVEDTPRNLDGVASALGTPDFQVWLTSAPQFAQLRASAYQNAQWDQRPSAANLFEILDAALATRASDVHIMVGVPPRVRTDGSMKDLDFQPLDRAWMDEQVAAITQPRHREQLEAKYSTDLAYTFGITRFRVNIATDLHGHNMTLRVMPSAIPTPDEINLPQVIRSFAHLEAGLVLVTGPTGSGKSTTLAAILNDVILNSPKHVITLEDPVEFRFPTTASAQVNQRELGQSFASFAEGLRDSLRQDPDVILVGELRDQETIRTAITAAETGHLVLGTLHTYDAPSTIMRLVNAFPADEQNAVRAQLATLLRGVVSQTLVPKAAGKGRIAAHEILINTTAIAANLRKPDGHAQIKQTMQTALSSGMQTMEGALARLVVSGQVTRDDAEHRAKNLDDFNSALTFFETQASNARGTE